MTQPSWWRSVVVSACLGSQLCGCRSPQDISYLGEADLQYYKQTATAVAYPNTRTETNDFAEFTERPPTVRDPSTAEPWDMSLTEAIQLAINNNKVIRSRGTFKSPANPLMSNPERVASTFDPAIQETNAGFFQRGPEAALAAFDTSFRTSLSTGRNESIQNNILLGGGIGGGSTLVSEQNKFDASLQKVFANGGSFEVSNTWNSLYTNQPFQLFPSYYRGYVRADYRQPLLAGAGVDFTRVAGPIARTLPGMSVTDGGVTIARINTDITVADFELNVTNMIRDVEDLYWELYLAYRTYDAELAAQQATFSFWKTTKKRMDVGARQGAVVDEAQARGNYFRTRTRLENAVGSLYATEGQFRRLLGLTVNDGKIIRPADEPLSAEYITDWRMALSESLVRRVELRRQKWQIKSLELQLEASRSLVKPRLDIVAGYQVNGFGDQLLSYDTDDGRTTQGLNSAISTLVRGDQTSWDMGLEFSMPIGFRQALATKRNLELRLSKARAMLATQELEISHELSNSVQLMDWFYQLAQTNFDARVAAERELEALQKEYNAGRLPIDLLLRSQSNLAAAEVGYHTALVKYNQALTDLRVRKGTLLQDNAIHLAEGDWTQDAYAEALRRAWARSYAFENKRVETEPSAIEAMGPPDYGAITDEYPDGADNWQSDSVPTIPGSEEPTELSEPPPEPQPLSGEGPTLQPVPSEASETPDGSPDDR
jgi:outer membrane protein TolC